jgi:hypothetical protein
MVAVAATTPLFHAFALCPSLSNVGSFAAYAADKKAHPQNIDSMENRWCVCLYWNELTHNLVAHWKDDGSG